MIIISVRVTRIQCLKCLFYYLRMILDRDLVDEIHIIDKLTHPDDIRWLRRNVIADKRVRIFEKGEPVYSDDDSVVNCDDTIVFIDIRRFDQFIKKGRAMAHVINGSSECIQFQRVYGFLSSDLFTPEICNNVYQNASSATELHNMFLDNFEEYLTIAEKTNVAKVNCVNGLFYVNGKGEDVLDMSMVVANLFTVQQIGDGFDDQRFLTKYMMLKDRYAKFIRDGSSDCKTD